MSTTNTKKKITKVQRFEDIKALIADFELEENLPNKSTIDDLIDFIDYEIDLLNRKNAPDPEKVKEQKAQDDKWKGDILDFLSRLPSDSEGLTATEINKQCSALNILNVQKVTSLVNGLEQEGRVVRKKVSGKNLISLT